MDMLGLADALDFFNDADNDEILSLYEQAKTIFARKQGMMSPNVATCDWALRIASEQKEHINLKLALSHLREEARVYRAIKTWILRNLLHERSSASRRTRDKPTVKLAHVNFEAKNVILSIENTINMIAVHHLLMVEQYEGYTFVWAAATGLPA